jgi:hypothetical protein
MERDHNFPGAIRLSLRTRSYKGLYTGGVQLLDVDYVMVATELALKQTVSDCAQLRFPMELQILLCPHHPGENLTSSLFMALLPRTWSPAPNVFLQRKRRA